MRIKTQFIICLVVFTITLLIIAVSVVATEQRVDYLNVQQEIASNIERGASNLNSISVNYFLYQEDLQLSRWNMTLSFLSDDLANIRANDSDQQMLVDSVVSDLQGLNAQFDDVVAYLQGAPRDVSVRIDPAFQFIWSGMALQSQILAFDASQLSQSINNQAHQVNTANILLILSLVGTFGAFLATMYFMVFRKTLASVTKLQTGINVIATGNLNHTITVKGKNEITELSHAFNQMTTNLKTVTISKAELEREIAERKKAEEALKQRTLELQRTQEKLEENATKIEEYASQMEELAEQRANQLKVSERLAAIGATAGMVGHDIRNPLQAIISDLFLAKSELTGLPENERKQNAIDSLNEIEKNIDYINKIIADLQDYARPLNPHAQENDIKLIVEEIIAKQNFPASVRVTVNVEDEARKIFADSDYLKRIVGNLTLNATQAMPYGGKLALRVYKEKQTGDIILTVKDTGVGIPENIKEKLFTPTFTTKSKGQGFGLAVVKRMTEALGGAVTFESEEGKGTKFILRFPSPQRG